MRALESDSVKSARKAKCKLHKACQRASETRERTLDRQEQNRTRVASMRESETFEQTVRWKERDRMYKASTRASETPDVMVLLFIIIPLIHANVWESMGKPCSCMQFIKSRIFYSKSCKNPYQYYKSRENPYQVLQVTRAASERAMKLKVRMIKSLSP